MGIVAELHERFGTPIEELAAWFGPINSTGNASASAIYQRSFLDGSVIGVNQAGALDLLQDVFRMVGDGPGRELALVRSSTADKWLAENTPRDGYSTPNIAQSF